MKHFTHLTSFGQTDIGKRRAANEDSILLLPEYGVFCVADGIGGSAGGAGSSSALVDAVTKLFTSLPDPSLVRTAKGKSRLIRHNANLVSEYIKGKSDTLGFRHAGTTAMMMMFDAENPRSAVTLHAGDSPAYRYRDDELKQITVDHTYAAQLPPEAVEKMPRKMRGVITRAVGVRHDVELEENDVELREGDVYLLFSDGVTNMVQDSMLLGLIRAYRGDGMEPLVNAIVNAANDAGGRDNISVVVIDVGELPPPLSELEQGARNDEETLAEPPADDERDEDFDRDEDEDEDTQE